MFLFFLTSECLRDKIYVIFLDLEFSSLPNFVSHWIQHHRVVYNIWISKITWHNTSLYFYEKKTA